MSVSTEAVSFERLTQLALDLPDGERALLLDRIRDSLLTPQEREVQDAWLKVAAKRFDVIERSVRRVRNNPRLFPVIDAPFRRLVILEFPYSLIYSIEADSVLIVAVAHQSREPEYWKTRLD